MVNFRGKNALMMMAEDGNARTLRDILEKLGFFVSRCDVLSEESANPLAILDSRRSSSTPIISSLRPSRFGELRRRS